jgi:hypothetical protein
MKKILILPLILISFVMFAQQSITSVSNGFATDPSVWDCTCIPQTSDDITINHAIQMNSDWLVNGSDR